jgi:hypothetical protein
MSRSTSNTAKTEQRPSEHFSLEGTLQSYEVQELSAHQIARFLADMRPGAGASPAMASWGTDSD